MEPDGKIQVTLLANEGIILQFSSTKILIDGIHVGNANSFSGLSELVLTDLMTGEKPLFKNINYLLYTHCHADHFTVRHNELFLQRHHINGLILPNLETMALRSLRQIAMQQADDLWLLDLPLGDREDIRFTNEISLTIFRSVHAGKQYANIENYCFLFNFAGRKVFIISDSEFNVEYFSKMLERKKIEIAFVNPLFINLQVGRDVITKSLRPERLVVYHIPFENCDRTGFRELVIRDKEKHQDSLPPIDILWDELQQITF
jgi:hypothetical protein